MIYAILFLKDSLSFFMIPKLKIRFQVAELLGD
jgi:hypothetical protein